jgi:hypothetical protein
MIISSQGEVCSPNDDIKALDLNGTNALRDRLRKIQASTGGGEEALLAGAEIELEQEKQADKAELAKIEKARLALQEFRDYLAQSSGVAAQALPNEEELEYSYNPDTQECAITRLDGQDIVLNLIGVNLQGELPLPPQLMVTKLDCSGNQITTLPVLPAGLTVLKCNSNQLTALPGLPDRLTVLSCYNNQLTSLPKLPEILTKLDCDNNQLTTLPELPTSLIELWCGKNPSLASDPATQAALKAMRDRGGQVS